MFFVLLGGLAIPPKPSTTRWGTWITGASFYANNFGIVRAFLAKLEEENLKKKKKKRVVNEEPVRKKKKEKNENDDREEEGEGDEEKGTKIDALIKLSKQKDFADQLIQVNDFSQLPGIIKEIQEQSLSVDDQLQVIFSRLIVYDYLHIN